MKKNLSLLFLPLIAAMNLHAADPFNDPFFNDPFGDDIFKEMMQMQHQMDEMFERMHQRMLQRSQRAVGPVAQFKMQAQGGFVDKGDHYELLTSIPESKENHIDIKTENGMISLTAKVVEEKEHKTPTGIAKSSSVRVYQQTMSLPADANESNITTRYEGGRLIVKIGKKMPQAAKIMKPSSPQMIEKKEKPKESDQKKEDNNTIKKMTINTDVPSMS